MRRPAVVIVTYKRQELLSKLLDSLLALTVAPWRVIVVDNEASERTGELVADYERRALELWGPTTDEPDAEGGCGRSRYVPMQTNTGGSGGFSEGVRQAFELGADWMWVMDDDVVVESDGLATLERWSHEAQVVMGQRRDFDGGHFYWQHRFCTGLGIYNPLSRDAWKPGERYKLCNVMCFEGAFFSREVVRQIGLPDARFFIYLDDALYGYLASKVTDVIYVPDYVLSRSREVRNQAVGSVRQLNSTSDMTRYYITRNRGYLARYFQLYGDYRPVLFAVGTLLTFAKELVRICMVDRKSLASGTKRLFAGWREQRRIQHDPTWEPMPPLA